MTVALRAEHVRPFVGRTAELALLMELVDTGAVVHLHGVAGVGKSALLETFGAQVRDAESTAVMLDCRAVEPTVRGILRAFGDVADVDALRQHLGSLGDRAVVVLDHYEVFRLMDTWIRLVLVPSLPPFVGLVLAGRERASASWFHVPRFRALPLGPLGESDAYRLLERLGVPESESRRLNRVARGHPLALTLASAGVAEHPELELEDAAMTRVVEELSRLYVEDVDDPATQEALEAAAVVRRVTEPILSAMLGVDGGPVLRRILELPFVEAGRDGLIVHDAVREAIAGFLRSTNPTRHRNYRRAAWRELRDEMADAAPSELWRYTADMLYLLANPAIREAFFPTDTQPFVVEPLRSEDVAAAAAIASRHEGPQSAAVLERWMAAAPSTCSVMRDREGVVGFSILLRGAMIRPPLVNGDPVVESWSRHLRDHPLSSGEVALGLRRWIDVDRGEAPGATQAASWLDAKRTYMELRPALRRMYVAVQDVPTYWPVVEQLGFRPFDDGPCELDGVTYTSVVLDFGPGSVDGWIAGLIGAELGVDSDPVVDAGAREIAVRGEHVRLTPLEFGLFTHLRECPGKTVTRYELLRGVWGTEFTGGSNVVDAVVQSLRRKLGASATIIEAVRGSGYRLRTDWQAQLA